MEEEDLRLKTESQKQEAVPVVSTRAEVMPQGFDMRESDSVVCIAPNSIWTMLT